MMLLALLLKNYVVESKWLPYGIMGLQNGILNNVNKTYIFGGDNASVILTFGNLPFSGVNFCVKVCYGSHGSLPDASHICKSDIFYESKLLQFFKSEVIKYKSSPLIHVFLKIFWRFALTKRTSSELFKILRSQ